MSEVSLFDHNEIAYQKLCDALKTNKCATINHATGTGKSFIALKYLHDNKDKKFLYLAPTYQILDQLDREAEKLGIDPSTLNYDRLIYRSLLDMDMTELFSRYDGFIFDEYHRCGARETYYRIKRLKELLKQQPNSDKSFIGLTATPIRYLDDERNMTNEIFDGVVASSLPLSTAMCDGLLPIPNYYISSSSVISEYNKARRKVSRLADSPLKAKLERQLDDLRISESYSVESNSAIFKRYINQEHGKYIIFCKDIETTQILEQNIRLWFKDIDPSRVFTVHSEQKKEESKKNLDAFNNAKDGFNVLLCVDVLNEGLHVDDIDGVILYRRTKSPIIYFQQIGRALSFSGRKKQIQIFDLVNNYDAHDAIYAVYAEFEEEIKRRIEQEPENAASYMAMLKKFKILDESKAVIQKIDKISEQVDDKAIILSKIDAAINYIINFIKRNKIKEDIYVEDYSDIELQDAYYTLDKYYRFVTNEQLARLRKTCFVLPPVLDVSDEERKGLTAEYNSIYEREKHTSLISIQNILNFVSENNRTPNEDSDSLFERQFFDIYSKCMCRLESSQLTAIKERVLELGIRISAWEKLLLHIKPDNDEYMMLIEQCIEIVKSGKTLPKHLYKALNISTLRYTMKCEDKIIALLKASDRIEKEEKKRRKEEQEEIIRTLNDSCFGESSVDDDTLTRMDEIIKQLDTPYVERFKKVYAAEKKKFIKNLIRTKERTEMTKYCRNIKSIPLDKFPNLIEMLESDYNMYVILERVCGYMKSHEDRLPSKNSENEDERYLCEVLDKAINEGLFGERILRLGVFDLKDDTQSSSHNVLQQIINEEALKCKLKIVIAKQIMFIKQHNRKPCLNSPNADERKIAEDYTNIAVANLSDSNALMLSSYMCSYRIMRNTLRAEADFRSE